MDVGTQGGCHEFPNISDLPKSSMFFAFTIGIYLTNNYNWYTLVSYVHNLNTKMLYCVMIVSILNWNVC